MAYTSRFRTLEKAARYRTAYETTLALWPVASEAVNVTTRAGMTHVNVTGAVESPPLLLIHGAQASSTQWYPNIEALSRHFRVYAPDVVDQAGLSVPIHRLNTRQVCAEWVMDVMDALDIKSATLVGHSYGAWLALNLAMAAPGRVERMALLSPGVTCFAPFRWRRAGLTALPALIVPTRGVFYRVMRNITTLPLPFDHPEPIIEQFLMAARCFKIGELRVPTIADFSDEDLCRVDVPALMLVGDRELLYEPSLALEIAGRKMPQLQTALIAGGGHLLPVDQPEAVNARMLAFFDLI